MKGVSTQELVDIYGDLLKSLWGRMAPTLGSITVQGIFERAAFKTGGKFPFLSGIKVDEEGVDLSEVRKAVSGERAERVKEAFHDLIGNLFDILAKLTGEAIASRIMREVEGMLREGST
ncbi:MAG TPA: hypothetical protein EYP65_02280 [Armatimonadetes bacterium]|nr:hypothetical protein [Armatimonadota bacterium]